MVFGSAIATLVVFQVVGGLWQTHLREVDAENLAGEDVEARNESTSALSTRFAALEALKLAITLVIVFVYRRRRRHEEDQKLDHRKVGADELPLNEMNGTANGTADGDEDSLGLHPHGTIEDGFSAFPGIVRRFSIQMGTPLSYLTLFTIAVLFMTKLYFPFVIYASEIIDPLHVYLSATIVPLLSAAVVFIWFKRTLTAQQWVGIILQICGFYSAHARQLDSSVSWSQTFILIALALYTSFTFVGLEYVYKLHDRKDPHGLNVVLFAMSLFIQLSFVIVEKILAVYDDDFSSVSSGSFISLLIRAGIDIMSILVIFDYDVVTFAVSSSFSVAMLALYTHLIRDLFCLNDLSTTAISVFGFLIFIVSQPADPNSQTMFNVQSYLPKLPTFPKLLTYALPFLATYAYLVYSILRFETGLLGTKITSSGADSDYTFTDLSLLPPPPPPPPKCTRDPLPSLGYFTGNRTYHEFDDVLLIVFFSHPRYDVNLDYYKEVYAEYFPNMVFVGPRNREDLGFNHSYDVFVDSYEADEDISDPNYYKMAGRMAHHMLYTVLTTSPYSGGCYNGYLWAPFDTLLNVPRLQKFDQNKTWYFSPWGEYVPNIAMNATAQQNASFHAPPARISPDPAAKNLTEGFRGWWVDWWWGDPHFGIPVCMPALEQVPVEMRQLMSTRYLNGTTRFLGGSADTLYIPERLKDGFLHVLGLFLNTSCFLEIAVPTTVHLIIPENDTIQFVDHWWIWEPPFNASFVRQTWEKGMEVDTFHTFHWGDKDTDGRWRAIPENIKDVRLLLSQSAKRQNVSLTPDSEEDNS